MPAADGGRAGAARPSMASLRTHVYFIRVPGSAHTGAMDMGRTASGAGAIVTAALAAAMVSAPPTSASTVSGCNRAWPVVAHRAGGTIVRMPSGARLPVACAAETGYATSESSIAVTKDGVLVYSPAETENSMARSLDAGASWS